MPEMLSAGFTYLRWKFTVSLSHSLWSLCVFYGLKKWSFCLFYDLCRISWYNCITVGMHLGSCLVLRHCLGGLRLIAISHKFIANIWDEILKPWIMILTLTSIAWLSEESAGPCVMMFWSKITIYIASRRYSRISQTQEAQVLVQNLHY